MQIGVGLSLPLLATRRSGGFSPLSLFTSGVQGAWYDPSDYSTLFTDSAGTTPVTAVEQPVGLMLDKSQGLVLGSEQIVNGGFATDSDWSKINGATISGGVANLFNAAAQPAITQTRNFTLGRTYLVSLTWTGTISAGMGAYGSGDVRFITNSSAGSFTGYVTLSAGTGATFWVQAPINVAATVDNISVRELAGNHALAPNDASRPVLRARYNLLTYSEDYSNAVWVKSNLTRTTGVADPFGGTSATTLTASGGSGRIYIAVPVVANANYTGSFYIRRRTGTGDINWESFTVGVGALITTTGSWTRVTVTSSTTITTAYFGIRIATAGDEIDVFAADFRPGSSAGTYQRIAAATDYATAGFLPYLYFVTDDSFSTGSINFSATDKMSVCAGVTKLSDAALGIVAELSTNWNTNAGSFIFMAPSAAAPTNDINFSSRGSAAANLNQGVSLVTAAPTTKVISALNDITASTTLFRSNGADVGTASGTKGTGNFGNYPLYIGRRNNATLPFEGRIYGLIVCGKALSASELSATESWMNSRTGAY